MSWFETGCNQELLGLCGSICSLQRLCHMSAPMLQRPLLRTLLARVVRALDLLYIFLYKNDRSLAFTGFWEFSATGGPEPPRLEIIEIHQYSFIEPINLWPSVESLKFWAPGGPELPRPEIGARVNTTLFAAPQTRVPERPLRQCSALSIKTPIFHRFLVARLDETAISIKK